MKQVLIDAGFTAVETICMEDLPNRYVNDGGGKESVKKWYVIKGKSRISIAPSFTRENAARCRLPA